MHSRFLALGMLIIAGLCVFCFWMCILALVFRLCGVDAPTPLHLNKWRALNRRQYVAFLTALCVSGAIFMIGSDYSYSKYIDPRKPFLSLENIVSAVFTVVMLWVWGMVDRERTHAKRPGPQTHES